MSLNRTIVCLFSERIHQVNYKGEPIFVIDNTMLEDINWNLNKILQINELMIIGQCIKHHRYNRLKVLRFV